MMNKINYIFLAILAISCSTINQTGECPEEMLEGSYLLNSPQSEEYPVYYNGQLTFMQRYIENEDVIEFLKIDNMSDEWFFPKPISELFFKGLKITSTPSYYYNPNSGMTEVFFAAINTIDGDEDEDIFYSFGTSGNFSYPVEIDSDINSLFNETMPMISPDGNTIVYVSDAEGNFGGTDIYVSNRINNGWSIPIILDSKINTEFDEVSPVISPEGDLYFSSNGFTDYNNFDIIKASLDHNGLWSDISILPFPFNTEYDEKGISFYDNEMLLASNREGGCGFFDIYHFERCKGGIVNFNISSKNENYPAVGKLEIFQDGIPINALLIDETGISINLNQGSYSFKFSSKCLSDGTIKDNFYMPCDEEFIHEKNIDILIPEPQTGNFSFEEYNIPFFVGGYFLPNTVDNLENLKLKFKYNQMDADSVDYVENPLDKYNETATIVDTALSKALNYLQRKVDNLASECSNSQETVLVKVVGFSDPRPMGKNSKYFGPDINDRDFNFFVENGAEIDNKMLSKLRAYYTAKHFEDKLKQNPNFDEVSFRFVWKIAGLGVDPNIGTTYDYNRRVKISVESVVN